MKLRIVTPYHKVAIIAGLPSAGPTQTRKIDKDTFMTVSPVIAEGITAFAVHTERNIDDVQPPVVIVNDFVLSPEGAKALVKLLMNVLP